MLRFSLFSLFAALLFAQGTDNQPANPPADVDKALRARITEFYDLQLKGQFRKAEALVAEDTRDFYYAADKPKYLSFEISRVDYFDNFTRAKATVLCEQYIMMPGFTDKPMKMPTPSNWKLVDGNWYWYNEPSKGFRTPFGIMTPGPPRPSARESGAAPSLPNIPADGKIPDWFFNQVKADKQSVSLKPGESERVTIVNHAPGTIRIALEGGIPGIEVKLEPAELKAGEKAVATLRAGKDAKPGSLNIRVAPLGQIISIPVSVN